MLLYYFKVAVRSAFRNKLTASINIIGLALAISCALLISLFVTDELAYDTQHPQASRLYRVTRTFYNQDGEPSLKLSNVAPPIGMLMKHDFPEIEKMFRTLSFNTTVTLPEEGAERKVFREPNIFASEPDILNMLQVKVLEGNPTTALEKPFTMMLSEPMALKYFGTTQVQGKHLQIFSNRYDFEITGVFKPFAPQTHFHPDFLLAFNTLNDSTLYGRRGLETNWGNNAFGTYFILKDGEDAEAFEKKLPDFLDRHFGPYAIANFGAPADFKASRGTSLHLQNIQDIHLKSQLDDELEPPGNINTVYLMGIIGVFIVLIASFNFINLSTAQATKRAREVGVRKVAGAYKTQLVTQYLSESVLMALLGFSIALGTTFLSVSWLNDFLGKAIQLTTQWELLVWALAVAILIGVLAGIYPALVVSGFKPAVILKSQKSASKSWLRRGLVVAQFVISVGLIIATAVIYNQLEYLNKKDLGYGRDQIVRLPYYGQLTESYDAFYNELVKNSAIVNASRSSRIPTGRLLDSQGAQIKKGDSVQAVSTRIADLRVDHEFFQTYQIPLVAGRYFSREIKSDDTLAYIINEAATRAMGFEPESIVDHEFTYGGRKGKIIGVVKDFHFESLHQIISPIVVSIPRQYYGNLSIQIAQDNFAEGLAHLEKTWNSFLPGRLFEYSILNQSYARLYETESKQSKLFTGFAMLAIVIACLGLFGLATFNALQRVKEIGIRKTLGASIPSILVLLSKEIVVLVIIANVVAWPMAWFYMDKWLASFAYRVDMNLLVFIGAGVIAVGIALLTVGWQCIRAAHTNPTVALRYE